MWWGISSILTASTSGSTLPYSIFTGRTITHITGSYINTTSKCLIIHIIISCLNSKTANNEGNFVVKGIQTKTHE
jgi:hypothetical protein